ncbi:hypothetical protein LTR56_027042 [Elasticomyces elasticus]|nr:hypothetical protein LTR56_027042 [Elasticomyces elasticus]KAK3616324.1 hypothetical protein LTR22_027111 [Elasticomyces elasticus]KAK4920042.1 hypothetical protein LTR49_012303 [Elasticomyces elasticus]KAK5735609.1 hypothetical protein LTS12_026413 [Elasticomyces elasticus]
MSRVYPTSSRRTSSGSYLHCGGFGIGDRSLAVSCFKVDVEVAPELVKGLQSHRLRAPVGVMRQLASLLYYLVDHINAVNS